MKRKLEIVYTPVAHQGFLGPDHIARPVLRDDFPKTDPFILLMDDYLDKKNNDPVGGPHPHAGFETVTLVLEGEIGDEKHAMKAGDFQMMTAGSGVVHTETVDKKARMRILQLWLTLPEKDRWATPRVQDLPLHDVPAVSGDGVHIKVYSGSFAGITSPVLNYVPLILADIRLDPGTTTVQSLPASDNTFMYVIEGDVVVGEEPKVLSKDQVGWLDRPTENENTAGELVLHSREVGVRLILYSGQPQRSRIVSHGPFIGNSEEDIRRLYREYREGKMKHVSTLPSEQMLVW